MGRLYMELGIPGDHGARLYMELGIPGDHGARIYMELESLEPKIRWVYMEKALPGDHGARLYMEVGIPGDHGARLYMELGIPGDHGARLYMELESLEPEIRWVYISVAVGGGLGPKGGPQPHYETTLLGAEGAEIFGKNSGFWVKNGTFLYFFKGFYQFLVKITLIMIKNNKLADFYPILEIFFEIFDFFLEKNRLFSPLL